MQQKHIDIILEKYFNNVLPLDLQEQCKHWLVETKDAEQKEQSLLSIWNSIPSEASELTAEEWDKLVQKINTNKNNNKILFPHFYRVASIFIIILLSSFLTYYSTKFYFAKDSEMLEYYADNGQQRSITLPDGSNVELNSGSLLIYPEDFKGNTRSIFLNGEARFTVTKNKEKPFIVRTKYLSVQALGTIFNVQAYTNQSRSIATLERGMVKVDTKSGQAQSVILNVNEQVIYDHVTHTMIKQDVDAKKISSWKNGYLVFQEASIDEILHTLERKFDVIIQFDSGKYMRQRITVQFTPEDSLSETLDILKEITPELHYKIKNKEVYIN